MLLKESCVIFIAGGVGCLARWLLSQSVSAHSHSPFPFGILIVNLLGCFLIGFLYVCLIEKSLLPTIWHAAILIGFLGGFTTFSSFSLDNIMLLLDARYFYAFTNIVITLCACLGGTAFGLYLGRFILRFYHA